jgi:hypothetical protein
LLVLLLNVLERPLHHHLSVYTRYHPFNTFSAANLFA